MNTTTPSLGIDVAGATFEAALWFDARRSLRSEFPNHVGGFRKLRVWYKRHGFGRLRVGLESTSTYAEALAHWLHEQGHEVLLLNPERVLRYAQARGQRNSTDPADARRIAEFVARHDDLTPWHPPAPEQKTLRSLLRVRAQLVEHRKSLSLQLKTADSAAAPFLRSSVAALIEQLQLIGNQIKLHLRDWPQLAEQVRRVMTIKGVGLITAATVIAELPPITPESDPRSICAWAGVIPRRLQSGKIEFPTRLSRKGNVYLRSALFMPALVAKRYNPLLRSFAERLKQRGKTNGAILGAISHKLLRIIVGMLRTKTDWSLPMN